MRFIQFHIAVQILFCTSSSLYDGQYQVLFRIFFSYLSATYFGWWWFHSAFFISTTICSPSVDLIIYLYINSVLFHLKESV